jgi:hypothetical protein
MQINIDRCLEYDISDIDVLMSYVHDHQGAVYLTEINITIIIFPSSVRQIVVAEWVPLLFLHSRSIHTPLQLTPQIRALLEKLMVAQLAKKLPSIYKSRRLIIVFTTTCHWTLSLAR